MRRRWHLPAGERVVHRPRREELRPIHLRLLAPRGPRRPRATYWTVALLFFFLIAGGTALLMLPWATEQTTFTPFLTALFTATSAVCVTGLVVVDTAGYWTTYGQVVIALLIFLGGLGIMTSATLLFILIGRRITLANRLLIQESMGTPRPGGVVRLVVNIVVITIAIQVVGFFVLWVILATGAGGLTRAPLEAMGYAAFHAVSAFNNAGFDIFPHVEGGLPSVTRFQTHTGFMLVTILMAFLGAISYTVMRDVAMVRLRVKRYLLDTKIVLVVTGVLLLVGTPLIFITEFSNDATMGTLSLGDKLLNSFFFASISRTAGLASASFADFHLETGFFIMGLMFIGGASGSTAGGIKVNTFAVLLIAVLSSIRGRSQPVAFGRSIVPVQVYRALVVVMVAGGIVFFTAILLTITEDAAFFPIFFETVSAFGTVGLSRGITPDLSTVGQIIITAAMFFGRLGPLTLALALAQQEEQSSYRYGEERVKIG